METTERKKLSPVTPAPTPFNPRRPGIDAAELADFLESVIENIPDMIFLKDARELRFVMLNRAGEKLLGYSRNELQGKNDYDFFPKQEADFFTHKDRETIDKKLLLEIPEEIIQTREKGPRCLHTKKIPILDSDGRPKYLLGISEDITDRKRAEVDRQRAVELEIRGEHYRRLAESTRASEQFLHEIVESMPQGIIIVDRGGFIRFASEKAQVLLNAAGDEVIGKRVGDPLANQVLNQVPAFSNAEWFDELSRIARVDLGEYSVNPGQINESRVRLIATKLKSGGLEGQQFRATANEDEGDGYAVLVVEEVTEHWRFEKLKEEFFSLVAHELKTPVTTIRSYAQLMRMLSGEERVKMQDTAFNIIEGQSTRLAKLIQDLLETSRLQVGRFSLHTERGDLGTLTEAVVDRVKRINRDRAITSKIETGLFVDLDSDRIEQVIDNILGNAIKYSPDKGAIHIEATKIGELARVSVQDFGLGVPEGKKSQIFEKYYRAHADTPYACTGGLGVGLYLSREFVMRHNGDIGFESEEGKGSTFFFTLPLI